MKMHLCISYTAFIHLMFREKYTFFHQCGPGRSWHQAVETSSDSGAQPRSRRSAPSLRWALGRARHTTSSEKPRRFPPPSEAPRAKGRPRGRPLTGTRLEPPRWAGNVDEPALAGPAAAAAAAPPPDPAPSAVPSALVRAPPPPAAARGREGARPAANKARPRPAATGRSPPPRRRPAGPSFLACTQAANGHPAPARGGSWGPGGGREGGRRSQRRATARPRPTERGPGPAPQRGLPPSSPHAPQPARGRAAGPQVSAGGTEGGGRAAEESSRAGLSRRGCAVGWPLPGGPRERVGAGRPPPRSVPAVRPWPCRAARCPPRLPHAEEHRLGAAPPACRRPFVAAPRGGRLGRVRAAPVSLAARARPGGSRGELRGRSAVLPACLCPGPPFGERPPRPRAA